MESLELIYDLLTESDDLLSDAALEAELLEMDNVSDDIFNIISDIEDLEVQLIDLINNL